MVDRLAISSGEQIITGPDGMSYESLAAGLVGANNEKVVRLTDQQFLEIQQQVLSVCALCAANPKCQPSLQHLASGVGYIVASAYPRGSDSTDNCELVRRTGYTTFE